MQRARSAHTSNCNPYIGQPLIGIVGAQLQTIFGTRGKHAIRLGDATRNKVIDHHTKISLRAIDNDFAPLARESCCIETRK